MLDGGIDIVVTSPTGHTDLDPLEFEDHVQRWLEALARTGNTAEEPLLAALREHVLPVIVDGTVRAAGPRARIAP